VLHAEPERLVDSLEPSGQLGRTGPWNGHDAGLGLALSGVPPPEAAPDSEAAAEAAGVDAAAKSGNRALAGHLYVVATPIGNLSDLSDRARAILASASLIACEDTRTTGLLLSRLGIRAQLMPYHEHNETEAAERVALAVAEGAAAALVTDAGTPGLSDPGFRVVRACRRRGLPVIPVPGPAAFAAVLSASGLPTNGFLFAGFLPPRTSARTAFFGKYRDFDYTLAIYESCHRIDKAVDDIVSVLGPERVICVAKEVSKIHEAFHVGPAAEVRARLASASLRGEFTVLIAPAGYVL